MGEVYRAHDIRLGRHVAIKIVPPAFTSDPDRLARFEREARVLASLNHPGIGAIYGIEESNEIRALVLELVDGDTLADRLLAPAGSPPRGLAVDEALAVARQIAEALDAAHERGVVHRDLKPANIGITREGRVKLLDFGLAKADPPGAPSRRDATPGYPISSAPTLAMTVEGMVLGTVAYMSPEQARGQAVDKRTDIWAFGCLLFEMLTGVAAFSAPTASDTIAAILNRESDWRRLPPGVAPSVRRMLRRCLQKDRQRRLRDIGDALADLTDSDSALDSPASSIGQWRAVQVHRLTDRVGMNEWPAISPDGKMVAYVAIADGRRQIWIQLVSGGAPLQLTRDGADHSQPRWSPESNALIYYTSSDTPGEEGTLWEVSALGGVPRPIANSLGGGDISHDGSRIALVRVSEERLMIVTVARDGSDPRAVAPVPAGLVWRAPRWSPDDSLLAFHGRGTNVWDERLFVVPAHGGEPRRLAGAAFIRGVSWLPDGARLVYSSSAGSTMPYPPMFNLHVADLDGSHDRQVTSGDVSFVDPDADRSGRIVACRIRSMSDIWRFPIDGPPDGNTRDAIRVTRQSGQVQVPSLSPDGSHLVYLSDHGGHANLWVAGADGTNARQITFERDSAVSVGLPKWSPAGDLIVYVAVGDVAQLHVVRPDGRGVRRVVAGVSPCWSPDGRWLYYTPDVDAHSFCIEKIPIAGGPSVVVRGDLNSHAPMVGRDALYFAAGVTLQRGSWDWEIRCASPETGPSELVGNVAATRLPVSPQFVHMTVSPDDKGLAIGLADGPTTNLWILGTADGRWRQVTDFGDEPTIIARQVSWSPDSRYLYAAVSKNNGDVVMLDGLV
jgi:eukaryotic-like serine/threonine-protein kinase